MTTRSRPVPRGRRLQEPPPARCSHLRLIILPLIAGATLCLAACGSSDAAAGNETGTGGAVVKPLTAAGGSGGGATAMGSGGSTNAGAASATGGEANGGASGAGGAMPVGGTGACCSGHAGVGCNDTAIQDCVCRNDPRCCTDKWDDVCVALVGGLGCGVCKTDCCTESTTPGCSDGTVESCVCAKSADCCNGAWDTFCVALVTSNAAGGPCGTCN